MQCADCGKRDAHVMGCCAEDIADDEWSKVWKCGKGMIWVHKPRFVKAEIRRMSTDVASAGTHT